MGIAENIRKNRKRLGWTTTELGAEVGVSQRTVDGWERGEGKPSIDNAAALALALNVTIEDLMKE